MTTDLRCVSLDFLNFVSLSRNKRYRDKAENFLHTYVAYYISE